MRVAIITEAYDGAEPHRRDGLTEVEQCVAALFPGAALFKIVRPRVIPGFRTAWRIARSVEDRDVRGFDLVVSLSAGFAHGIITDTEARHVTYCLARPELARRGGVAGHWYRFWDGAALARVDGCVASTEYLGAAMAKVRQSAVPVLRPPVAEPELRPGEPERGGGVVLVSGTRNVQHRSVCIEACNKLEVPLVVEGSVGAAAAQSGVLIYDGDESFPAEALGMLSGERTLITHRQNPAVEFARGRLNGVVFDDWHPGVVADSIRRALERKSRPLPVADDGAYTPEAFGRAFMAIIAQTSRS